MTLALKTKEKKNSQKNRDRQSRAIFKWNDFSLPKLYREAPLRAAEPQHERTINYKAPDIRDREPQFPLELAVHFSLQSIQSRLKSWLRSLWRDRAEAKGKGIK